MLHDSRRDGHPGHPVTVFVFGYADDQGEADNGRFNASTASSALKVG